MKSPSSPFDPLGPNEIKEAANIVLKDFGYVALNFRFITSCEPPKAEMVTYLDGLSSGKSMKHPQRRARVQVILRNEQGRNELWELIVSLCSNKIDKKTFLEGKHSYIDADYMMQVEKACMSNKDVQKEIELLELPAGATVIVEPWAYATDGMNDMSQRTSMCWFYMRLLSDPDANFYAYPLDLCAEVSENLEVSKIYRLPSSEEERIHHRRRPFDRNKIHSAAQSEYYATLRDGLRTSTKPLHVVQPEGPSFQVEGTALSWEKWSMYVGFNYREGMTLHDVRYEGRSIFYRLSLAEMFVPYGDPRSPYPRKGAFDLGNDGAGINANNLRLGCDCLGHIQYFDGWHNTSSGDPLKLPNVICCHEQDDGIMWKHTNWRTGNAAITRSRVLVLQTVITVTNYEYIFAFHFGQDASIHYEVRATGILSTAPINLGDKVSYGTIVAPGVMAPYHQHLFSLRIDPAIDGHKNSLQIEEVHPMDFDDAASRNPFGVGYTTKSHIVEQEQGLDLDITKARTFKIINEGKINPITGTPVGFKLYPSYSQMLQAHPQSYHARRSEFAKHAVWVTRYHDDELFPAGRHTMQSLGEEGIESTIKERRNQPDCSNVRNEDIVIWHTFGSQHIPRIEDWPIMPSEKMTVGLKPVNFFSGNPALDVAPSTQQQNRSVLVGCGTENGVAGQH